MPYGTKTETLPVSYVSTFPGSVSWSGSSSVDVTSRSRSGANGIYRKNQGHYLSVRKTVVVRGVVEIRRFKRLKKVVVGYRLKGGKPILRSYMTGSGVNRRRQSRIVGYTPVRKVPYYRWDSYDAVQKLYGPKIVHRMERIYIPGILEKDVDPHNLYFVHTRRLGHDSGFTVNVIRDSDKKVGTTSINGMMSGVHAGPNGAWGTNVGFQDFSSNGQILAPLRNEALCKLYNSARNGIADLTVAAAEAPKLKAQVFQYFQAVSGILLNGKRKLSDAIRDGLTDPYKVASGYLGIVYGLSPAISDFNNVISELNKRQTSWRKYRGRSARQWKTFEKGKNAFSEWTITREFFVEVRYRTIVTATQQLPYIRNHSVSNAFSTGWELIPWSFAVDWLIPIGNWLSSWDTFSGVVAKNYHETITYKERYTYTLTHTGSAFGYRVSTPQTQTFSGEFFKCVRTVSAGQPPAFPFPQIKNPFTKRHVLNSIFLTISKLR